MVINPFFPLNGGKRSPRFLPTNPGDGLNFIYVYTRLYYPLPHCFRSFFILFTFFPNYHKLINRHGLNFLRDHLEEIFERFAYCGCWFDGESGRTGRWKSF